jgi:hypothetical protein
VERSAPASCAVPSWAASNSFPSSPSHESTSAAQQSNRETQPVDATCSCISQTAANAGRGPSTSGSG